jgi:imidazolonepropionase-like amidohydrolase
VLKAIVEEAGAAGTYVMAHAYTPKAIARAVRCGVRSIEHGNLIDDETAALMAEFEAFAVPTLVTYDALMSEGEALGLPPASVAKINAVRAPAREALKILAKHGVTMAFGTDLLGESHRHQSQEFALRAAELGNAAAIQAATCNAARLLNKQGEIGVVSEGAAADLLVVRGNPLESIECLVRPDLYASGVMKRGKFVRCVLPGPM